MHSFFQPKAKKAKLEPKQQPRSVLSWNVNGLLSVVADKATSKPAAELKAFISARSRIRGHPSESTIKSSSESLFALCDGCRAKND